jgi:hypothetical protein
MTGQISPFAFGRDHEARHAEKDRAERISHILVRLRDGATIAKGAVAGLKRTADACGYGPGDFEIRKMPRPKKV